MKKLKFLKRKRVKTPAPVGSRSAGVLHLDTAFQHRTFADMDDLEHGPSLSRTDMAQENESTTDIDRTRQIDVADFLRYFSEDGGQSKDTGKKRSKIKQNPGFEFSETSFMGKLDGTVDDTQAVRSRSSENLRTRTLKFSDDTKTSDDTDRFVNLQLRKSSSDKVLNDIVNRNQEYAWRNTNLPSESHFSMGGMTTRGNGVANFGFSQESDIDKNITEKKGSGIVSFSQQIGGNMKRAISLPGVGAFDHTLKRSDDLLSISDASEADDNISLTTAEKTRILFSDGNDIKSEEPVTEPCTTAVSCIDFEANEPWSDNDGYVADSESLKSSSAKDPSYANKESVVAVKMREDYKVCENPAYGNIISMTGALKLCNQDASTAMCICQMTSNVQSQEAARKSRRFDEQQYGRVLNANINENVCENCGGVLDASNTVVDKSKDIFVANLATSGNYQNVSVGKTSVMSIEGKTKAGVDFQGGNPKNHEQPLYDSVLADSAIPNDPKPGTSSFQQDLHNEHNMLHTAKAEIRKIANLNVDKQIDEETIAASDTGIKQHSSIDSNENGSLLSKSLIRGSDIIDRDEPVRGSDVDREVPVGDASVNSKNTTGQGSNVITNVSGGDISNDRHASRQEMSINQIPPVSLENEKYTCQNQAEIANKNFNSERSSGFDLNRSGDDMDAHMARKQHYTILDVNSPVHDFKVGHIVQIHHKESPDGYERRKKMSLKGEKSSEEGRELLISPQDLVYKFDSSKLDQDENGNDGIADEKQSEMKQRRDSSQMITTSFIENLKDEDRRSSQQSNTSKRLDVSDINLRLGQKSGPRASQDYDIELGRRESDYSERPMSQQAVHLDKLSQILKDLGNKKGRVQSAVSEKLIRFRNKEDKKSSHIELVELQDKKEDKKEETSSRRRRRRSRVSIRLRKKSGGGDVESDENKKMLSENKTLPGEHEKLAVENKDALAQAKEVALDNTNIIQGAKEGKEGMEEERERLRNDMIDIKEIIRDLVNHNNLKSEQKTCLVLLLWAIEADMPDEFFQRLQKSKTFAAILQDSVAIKRDIIMYNMYIAGDNTNKITEV